MKQLHVASSILNLDKLLAPYGFKENKKNEQVLRRKYETWNMYSEEWTE